MALRDALRDMTVVGETGAEQPLVLAEDVVVPGTGAADPDAPPSWLAFYLLLGVVIGGLLAWSGGNAARGAGWARYVFVPLAILWSLVAGVVGTILVLVLLTDHDFMIWNANLFLLSPLSLALAVLVPLGVRRRGVRLPAERLAMTVVGLAMVGLGLRFLSSLGQDNAIFFALAVPAHMGLWWALRHSVRGAP